MGLRMGDSIQAEWDFGEFCARVLREYEEVIATVIQRPLPSAVIEAGVELVTFGQDGVADAA
jgi:hypothetical protein